MWQGLEVSSWVRKGKEPPTGPRGFAMRILKLSLIVAYCCKFEIFLLLVIVCNGLGINWHALGNEKPMTKEWWFKKKFFLLMCKYLSGTRKWLCPSTYLGLEAVTILPPSWKEGGRYVPAYKERGRDRSIETQRASCECRINPLSLEISWGVEDLLPCSSASWPLPVLYR